MSECKCPYCYGSGWESRSCEDCPKEECYECRGTGKTDGTPCDCELKLRELLIWLMSERENRGEAIRQIIECINGMSLDHAIWCSYALNSKDKCNCGYHELRDLIKSWEKV